MSEHREPIPSMIYNASVGGHLTTSQQIIDENENKEQSQINAEVKQSLGQGGSVDARINQAKNDIIGGASSDCDTLGKAEALISSEKTRAQTAEEQLRTLYNNLQQSKPVPVDTLPATGEAGKIYRLAGTTSYADYMYAEGALTTPIKMAEYDNAIDDEPTAGSNNLIKSGGVFKTLTKGVLHQEGVTSAVWFDLNSLKGRRFKFHAENENSELMFSLYRNTSAFFSNLNMGVEYYMDFTGFEDSDNISIYYIMSTDTSIYWEELEEGEFPSIIYNSDVSAIPYNCYYTTDFNRILYKAHNASAPIVFPIEELNSSPVAAPKGDEVFTINGWKYVYNNGIFNKIAIENDIPRTKIVTKILSRYGYINSNGVLTGLDEQSTDCYVTDKLLPVKQGDTIIYLGGYSTKWKALFGYSSENFDNPVNLYSLPNGDINVYSCVIDNPDIHFVGCFGKTNFEPAIAVIPKELITRDYDFYVAADGSGDCESLFHVIQLTKALDSERHINIFVKSGLYNMIKGNNEDVFADARNISIIGEDKNSVIIYNNNGEYTGRTIDNTPIRLSGNVALSNLTVISRSNDYVGTGTPCAYCVHVDFNTNGQESVVEIENCRMFNDHYACIAAGLRDNLTLRIKNCELRSISAEAFVHKGWNGAIICHDGNQDGINQNIEFIGNILECTGDYAIALSSAYQKQINATFIRNAIFSATENPIAKGSLIIINNRSCLNNVSEVNYQQ